MGRTRRGAEASGVGHWISALLASIVVAAVLLVSARRLKLKSQKRKADVALPAAIKVPAISFYSRMVEALKAQGMQRATNQTPLEFANSTGMPEAVRITAHIIKCVTVRNLYPQMKRARSKSLCVQIEEPKNGDG